MTKNTKKLNTKVSKFITVLNNDMYTVSTVSQLAACAQKY
jgi:hypothetical protein